MADIAAATGVGLAPEAQVSLGGDTPALRLIGLLELVAGKDRPVSLQGLCEETGLPKPTLHRMLAQLEQAGLLVRGDGRHYSTGERLHRLAETALMHGGHHRARHAVLADLVSQIGESCNLTALSGTEVVYLDRVETPEPLRFTLHAGSRVPAHASASGKMIVAQLSPAQRRRLFGPAPLRQYTPKTLAGLDELDEECVRIRRDGYALDDGEYLPGLVCIAVLVPSRTGRSNLCVAAQGPQVRLTHDRAVRLLPVLQRAARAIRDVEDEGHLPA